MVLRKITAMTCLLLCQLLLLSSCGKDEKKSGTGIFSFSATTIVTDATPSKLQTNSAQLATQTMTVISQIKDRLYTSQAGNTIPNIIKSFDNRVAELNARAAEFPDNAKPACLTATPVTTTIKTPDGQSFSMSVQCYDDFGASGFMVWGVDASKNISIFERGPNTISIVKVTPNGDKYIFDGYLATNYLDGANSSGTIVRIVADQLAKSVQASMAAPHEVCGASIYGDTSEIHVRGSVSTGTANECPAESDLVYSATDLSISTGFDASKLLSSTNSLRRKAGKKIVNGAVMEYQEYGNASGLGNLSLTQETTATTSETDINFGPTTVTEMGGSLFK